MKVQHQNDCMAALVALVAAEGQARAGDTDAAWVLLCAAKLKLVKVMAELYGRTPESVMRTVGSELASLRRGEHPCAVLDSAFTKAGSALQ